MTDAPFTFDILENGNVQPSKFDNHIVRKLSAMSGQFEDLTAYEKKLEIKDEILYEVYEIKRPQIEGELLHGISILHPGKVGREYNMTKGHFHTVLETSEVYFCLRGDGFMVMETPEGEWSVVPLKPNSVLYVPPRWAHRSVNVNDKVDLVTFFVYPGNSGHDYGSIEKQGFRKLIVEQDEKPVIIDNPRWLPPEER